MIRIILLIVVLTLVSAMGYIGINYYSYVFSKTIRGEVVRIERVNSAEAIIASKNVNTQQLFSFAVAIRDEKGEIHTASTEDRQWAIVNAGQCAEAKFFPYPPWELGKGRTYFGARLERLYECH